MAEFQSFVYINWWNILVTMCNTLITFAIIKKFLFKPVRKMLAAREEEVQAMYGNAEKAQTEAEQMRSEYTERLAKAKEEAAEIVGSATRRATVRSEEILKESSQQAAAMMKKMVDGCKAKPECLGIFYWEPECYGGWNGYNKGAFTSEGKPTDALKAFKN